MSTRSTAPARSGRRAEASRNDRRILDAAQRVFLDDPSAPIARVAEVAGVGIAALYRRFESKEGMLARLCLDGQDAYLAAAEAALSSDADPWAAYAAFLSRILTEETPALAGRLAGTFRPSTEHIDRAARLRAVTEELHGRAAAAGAIRPGVTALDVGFLIEAVSRSRLGGVERTAQLHQRLLDIVLLGVRSDADPPRGAPPTWEEQELRWVPEADVEQTRE